MRQILSTSGASVAAAVSGAVRSVTFWISLSAATTTVASFTIPLAQATGRYPLGSGLFEYVQLFVISNGTLTKYYSNTTRSQHLKEGQQASRRRKTSNSFEFTSWWADARNQPIRDLIAFAKTFFARHTLLNVLTRYCILTEEG